ncbi:MAG TPA: hypothetical protein VEG38_00900 [Acidimicrobiia bacterium]|nr:hypothetical protein [Acidimicrobiia bacterium]
MRRLHRILPFVLITGIAAAACGAAELAAPRIALRQAAAQVANAPRSSFTLSFSGQEADAVALFSEGEQEVTDEDRKHMATLFRSRLAMVFDQGADRDDPKDDASDVDLRIGHIEHAIQSRQVDGKLYARADVRNLVNLFGGSTADVDAFLRDSKDMGLDFLPGAVDGGWLALDIAPLESFFKGLAKSTGDDMFGGFDPTNIDAGVLQPLISAVAGAYGSDVEVERLSADDSGQHYRLAASARRLYERLLPELKKLPMLKGLGEDEFPPAADVPDQRYELDVWVADRTITRAEFNLSQLVPADRRPGPVTLRVDVNGRADGIAAPGKSELIDIFEIWGNLMGSFTAGADEEEADFD